MLDMCQHVPRFITDKTCLGAPGGQNIGKMWNKICGLDGGVHLQRAGWGCTPPIRGGKVTSNKTRNLNRIFPPMSHAIMLCFGGNLVSFAYFCGEAVASLLQ